MTSSYVGILTPTGLELCFREGECPAQVLATRLRRSRHLQACCVWFVMDDQFESTVDALLTAGYHDSAWAFVQHAAREAGVVLQDEDCGLHRVPQN